MFSPMRMGFPGGMAGGGIAQFLQPLQQYLSEKIASEKVQPFIDEISQLAQDRFDVDFGGGIFNAGGGGDLLGGNMLSPVTPPLPAIQQPIANTGSSAPVADLTNFGPDVGNGIPTAKPYDHVNDSITGFPSVNEPMPGIAPDPRPLMNGFPVAQPELGGNVGGDFMGSAQNYFGNNIDPRGPVTPMTPEDILRQAQGRLMQQDVKSPEVQAYLDNIIKTGGRPTIMAPKANYSNLADEFGNLFQLPSVGPMYGPEGTYSLTGGPRPASQDPYERNLLSRAVNQ